MSSNNIYSHHYYNRYTKFIESCRIQNLNDVYTEKHHIIPRSLGGTNDESNLITLSGRQHYIAHWMLWKAYRGKMALAFKFMNHDGKHARRINSKIFEQLRKDRNEHVIKVNTGKTRTQETKDNIRNALKGKVNNRKGERNTQEHTANIVKAKSKNWIVTTPTGQSIEVFNLKQFCKDHKISYSNLALTAKGGRPHASGYTAIKV